MKRMHLTMILFLAAVLIAFAGTTIEKPMEAPSFGAFREPLGSWEIAGKVSMDPAKKTALTTEAGTGVFINNRTKKKNAHLITKKEYADMELHIEFLVPENSNSGIYFMNRYEVQIFDSAAAGDKVKYSDCGGIYQRWDGSKPKGKQGFEGTAPLVNASLPPGEWQTFDILFRAPRFDANGKKIQNARFVKVLLNGKLVQKNVEVTGPTRAAQYKKGEPEEVPLGPLKLQGDHGPVAFRNILIRPVQLD